MKNIEAAWEQFDPELYLKKNYFHLRQDDAVIVDAFVRFIENLPVGIIAADIGAGPNIWPSLVLATRAKYISLIEMAPANIDWIVRQLDKTEPPEIWWPFIKRAGVCANVSDYPVLWQRLKNILEIRKGSIFDLPKARWDLTTMYFVAESITDDQAEFESAMKSYFESVRQDGWYFAAFMEKSRGYRVGDIEYPSYPITTNIVKTIADHYCFSASVSRIPIMMDPIRTGYTGMIILQGRRDK